MRGFFFQQTIKTRACRILCGAGLALPIAKKIAEAHGGRLEMVNDPDRGVTARIVLPAG